MSDTFPINTVFWIMFAVALIGVLVALAFNQGLSRLNISPGARRTWLATAAIGLAGWYVVRLALGFNPSLNQGPLLVVLSFVVIFTAMLLAMAWWDWPVERIKDAMPLLCASDIAGLHRFWREQEARTADAP